MRIPKLPADSKRRTRPHSSYGLLVILSAVVLLAVIVTAVAYHPESIQGAGRRLLAIDTLLLLMYGAAGVWAYYDTRPHLVIALRVGTRVGVLLGAVLIANHLIELFVNTRPFIVIIGPVLLLIGLLGAAGSATWQRLGSLGSGWWLIVRNCGDADWFGGRFLPEPRLSARGRVTAPRSVCRKRVETSRRVSREKFA